MKKFVLLTIGLFLSVLLVSQNTGLLFDGNNEFVKIDHKPVFNITNSFTIEAWILANQWKAEQWRGSIVTKDGPGPDAGYAFRCGDGGRLSFVMAIDNGWKEVFSDPIMNENQWHHVAAVYDNGNMSLYLDGQPIVSSSFTGTPSANDRDLFIGQSAGFAERFFDGIIDEVRIWNIARTDSEISDNTTTDFAGTENGLIAYFPMNDGSGNVATNLVDNSCSGALANMDDSNWIEGYTIPEFDVSPSKIAGLDIINLGTRPIRLDVNLQNNGSEIVTGIPLEIYIDGELAVTETFNGSIAPGELVTHTFFTPLDLTTTSNPEIEVRTALSSDSNAFNNSTSTKVNSITGNTIRLMDGVQHSFGSSGRIHNSSVVLPADLSGYESILLHISLDCPSSGCDPWDQPASVSAITNTGTFEVARYITPYGIACGPWTVDITDFKDVLQGPVDFRSFIQVWGVSGWMVTLDLELIEGNASKPFSKLSPLWETDYWVYGDPGLNDDLPVVNVDVEGNTEASHIRMTMSGHGQGNTDNAAEFSNVTHNFVANGSVFNAHNLWKPDCESNICANQAGNWVFDRAGWCPGEAVEPYTVATTSVATPGSSASFDYALQDYTNTLNTGYNGGNHTEPHYRIFSYFIETSANRYEEYFNLLVDSIYAEISGSGDSQVLDKMSISISNDGSQPITNFAVSYFINNQFVVEENVNTTIAVGETYIHEFASTAGFTPNAYNKVYGVVSQGLDQNSGDNISRKELNPQLNTSVEDLINDALVIYPNPSSGEFINIDFGNYNFNGSLLILNQNGMQVAAHTLNQKSLQINLPVSGMYFLQFEAEDGTRVIKKLIVQPN